MKHWKLYIAGISVETLPILPPKSIAWSIQEHFQLFSNHLGTGCHLNDCFTLLPREWIRRTFKDTQVFYQCFLNIIQNRKHKRKDPRGDDKVPVYDSQFNSTYLTFGQSCSRKEAGLIDVNRELDKEEIRFEREVLHKYFGKMTHCAKAYMDTASIVFSKYVRAMTNYNNFRLDDDDNSDSIWPTIAIAINVLMEMHCDNDYFIGAVGVLGENGFHEEYHAEYSKDCPSGRIELALPLSNESILQYFCFPTAGVSVALRNGDVLLFNALLPHCISSRATKSENVICTSLYLKTALVGGNDNTRIVADIPIPN
jgi:hypothetical protein